MSATHLKEASLKDLSLTSSLPPLAEREAACLGILVAAAAQLTAPLLSCVPPFDEAGVTGVAGVTGAVFEVWWPLLPTAGVEDEGRTSMVSNLAWANSLCLRTWDRGGLNEGEEGVRALLCAGEDGEG